jgi:hypothetical protein
MAQITGGKKKSEVRAGFFAVRVRLPWYVADRPRYHRAAAHDPMREQQFSL